MSEPEEVLRVTAPLQGPPVEPDGTGTTAGVGGMLGGATGGATGTSHTVVREEGHMNEPDRALQSMTHAHEHKGANRVIGSMIDDCVRHGYQTLIAVP